MLDNVHIDISGFEVLSEEPMFHRYKYEDTKGTHKKSFLTAVQKEVTFNLFLLRFHCCFVVLNKSFKYSFPCIFAALLTQEMSIFLQIKTIKAVKSMF